MNKNEENQLADAIIALHQEIKGLRSDMDKQLAKINLALGEMRLSYMKLDERVEKLDINLNERIEKLDINLNERIEKLDNSFNRYAKSNNDLVKNHETRIVLLEERAPGNAYIAREPRIEYKKKKRKK